MPGRMLRVAAVLLLVACDTPVETRPSIGEGSASAGSDPPVAWVEGSYYRPSSNDDDPGPELQQSATFAAMLHGDGSVSGNVRVRFHQPGGALVIDLQEEVTCLVVAGSTAWIGTVAVREQLSEGQPSRLGRPVVWQVRDVGVGGDLAQRLIDTPDCNTRPEILPPFGSLHGDLRVVDNR